MLYLGLNGRDVVLVLTGFEVLWWPQVWYPGDYAGNLRNISS